MECDRNLQKQEGEAVGHVVSVVKKQRETNACAQLKFSFFIV